MDKLRWYSSVGQSTGESTVVDSAAALVEFVASGGDCVWVFAGTFAADGDEAGGAVAPVYLVLSAGLSNAGRNAMMEGDKRVTAGFC